MWQAMESRIAFHFREAWDEEACAHLQLCQVLEQHLVDGALAELRRQNEHALQSQLPQVCVAVAEAGGYRWEHLPRVFMGR